MSKKFYLGTFIIRESKNRLKKNRISFSIAPNIRITDNKWQTLVITLQNAQKILHSNVFEKKTTDTSKKRCIKSLNKNIIITPLFKADHK